MLSKSVLRACVIGMALMMQSAHAAAPNTVVGCVEVPYAYAACDTDGPVAIAITPNGKKAYVCNSVGDSVSVVDVASDTVIRCVDVPSAYIVPCGFSSPQSIAITPNGTKAYVGNKGNNKVSVIDVASDTVIGCVDVPPPYSATCFIDVPKAIAITPNGAKAYVCNQGGNSVSIIDIATDMVTGCVEPTNYPGCGFNSPQSIAITPDGTKAYVSNFSGGSVSVIDVASDSVIGCVKNTLSCQFANPSSIAITPDGKKAYVVNESGTQVISVIDVASDNVIACVDVPSVYSSCFQDPVAIAITPDGTTAYVTCVFAGNPSVSIIDLASNSVIGCVENPYPFEYTCGFNEPVAIAITPDGTKAYVGNVHGGAGTGSVSVIELRTPVNILPPASVSGCKTKNIFLLQTDFINNITWTAPTSGTAPVAYKIYRDPALTQLVATVPASGPLQFYDHNRNPGVVYSYFIVSVDGSGNVSTANSVTVTQSCGLVRDVHSM